MSYIKQKALNLSLITDIEIDGVDLNDYPDFCDAFIMSAIWSDSGQELSDHELDILNDFYTDFVYNKVMEYVIGG